MTHERNAQALVALVAEDAAQRIATTLAAAREDADHVRREAHAAARMAMRTAHAAEQQRQRERVGLAQAALDTRERLALQRRNAALVAAGLRALPAALQARWQDDAARAAWVAGAVAQAHATLPPAAWDVRHPAAWALAERDALARRIAEVSGQAPAMIADATLDAGLAIGCEGTLVDARAASLVSDRNRIGARLLHHAQAVTAANGP